MVCFVLASLRDFFRSLVPTITEKEAKQAIGQNLETRHLFESVSSLAEKRPQSHGDETGFNEINICSVVPECSHITHFCELCVILTHKALQ